MKQLLILLMLFIGPCLPAERLPVISEQDMIESVMQSVVYVKADTGWSGSGVYVGGGLIMTARHVVRDASEFTIRFENGEEWSSDYTIIESESDVGFIYINPFPGCSPLKFNLQEPRRGDTVYILGNPFGLEFAFSVTKGIVSGTGRDSGGFFGNKLILQIDALGYPGDSGGPVVNERGEIVGLLVGGYDTISLCIPAEICNQALRTAKEILRMKALE